MDIPKIIKNKYLVFNKYKGEGIKIAFIAMFKKSVRNRLYNRLKSRRDRKVYGYFLTNKKSIKQFLLSKSNKCSYCGTTLDFNSATIDHINHTSKKKDNRIKNLRLLCVDCHRYRHKEDNLVGFKPLSSLKNIYEETKKTI